MKKPMMMTDSTTSTTCTVFSNNLWTAVPILQLYLGSVETYMNPSWPQSAPH